MDFKNTADDLIDYEIKIDNITGANNRAVTTTRAPKKILSKVTQQMVDDYKRSLIQPYVDEKTGDKFLYKPVVPVVLNDVKRAEVLLQGRKDAILNDIVDQKQILIGELNQIESKKNEINRLLEKKTFQPISIDEYTTKIFTNSNEIRDTEKEIKRNLNEIVKIQRDIDKNFKLYNKSNNDKKRNELLATMDGLEIKKFNIEKIIDELDNKLIKLTEEKNKMEEELHQTYQSSTADLKQIEYAREKIKRREKKLRNDLNDILLDEDNVNQMLQNDIKDLQIMKEENKQKIQEYNRNFKELNQNVDNMPVQEPGEQEEDYLLRLEQFSGQKYSDNDIISSLEYKMYVQLKDNFKKLFNLDDQRKLSVVESFLNIPEMKDIEERKILLTKFPLFEKKFLETYGFDNSTIKPQNILEFWENLKTPPVLPYSLIDTSIEKEILTQMEKDEKDEKDKKDNKYGNLHEFDYKDGKNNDKKLYIIFINRNFKTINNYAVGLSKTGKIGSFSAFQINKDITIDEIIEQLKKLKFVDNSLLFAQDFKTLDEIEYAFDVLAVAIKTLYASPKKSKLIPTQIKDAIGEKKEDYIKRNPTTNEIIGAGAKKTKKNKIIGRGISLPEVPDIISFGKVNLLYSKLINNNVLSIKDKKNKSIANCKNVTVSDHFVNIVSKIIDNVDITNDYHELTEDEKIIYNSLMILSGLSKVAKVPKPSIQFFKNKVQLLSGEIEAGNDNIKVKEDLQYYLNQLVLFKAITKKQAQTYFNQIIN